MARRPEFGAVVATVLVYLFFAITTQGGGFVSIDGTAGWLDTAAELGIIAIPVGVLMVAGAILFVAGLAFTFGARVPLLGRLPGDLVFRKGSSTFYFPLVTCLLISIVLSGLFWLFNR